MRHTCAQHSFTVGVPQQALPGRCAGPHCHCTLAINPHNQLFKICFLRACSILSALGRLGQRLPGDVLDLIAVDLAARVEVFPLQQVGGDV